MYFLYASIFALAVRACAAIEPVPQAPDMVTMVNRDSQKDVRLDANIYIPDGGEVLLTIDVPREPILIDSHAPAKVTRVYANHADGVVGVGENIDILVEFTSAVDVVGAPALTLATGCHVSACHVREVQRLRCQGTTGKFAVGFDDQRVVNVPWDASTKQFAQYLQRMTKIDIVHVQYLQDDGKACTFFGNNITVTFESMNIDGIDGDLSEMTADAANTNGDGSVLGHVRLTPTLSANAWEIQKGRLVPDRQAVFVDQPDPRTLRFTYTVQNGDNTTRLEYTNSDALTRNLGTANQVLNAGTLIGADTTLPPPKFPGDWERGMGSSLSANARIQVDVSQPTITGVTSPHDDGTFGIGEVILVQVQFSLPIVVTGLPTIVLETGQVDRIIPFTRVTGAAENTVEFQYSVQAKDTSPDLTYTGTTALNLNGGSIKRKSTTPWTNAILTLPVNGERGSLSWTKNIVIDTSDPKVTGVTAITADGTYTGGDSIQIQVAFDTPVVVTGSPQLILSTGSVDLFPGSFVQEAPALPSTNTIVFPSVDHGLSTQQSQGLQFLIDSQVYTVATVSGDAVTMVENYVGTVVDPTVINGPTIAIQSPGYRPARYTSGSGTRLLLFTYDIQRGDSSTDLDYVSTSSLQLNGGTIKRLSTTPYSDAVLTLAAPGTAGSLSSRASIAINTNPPRVIQAVPLTRDGVYQTGDEILLAVVFDLPVLVQNIASVQTTATPTGERAAVYVRGSGSTSLVFRLLCAAQDQTAVFDVFSLNALRPAYGYVSGFIRRRSNAPLIPAILDLPISGLTSKAISIDQSCADVTSVTTSHEAATAGTGEVVDILVTYSGSVDVDTTAGVPSLQLTSQRMANYVSGTGSPTLTFRYIVQVQDPRVQLGYVDIFSLQLNGGRLQETATGKIVSTLLPDPHTTLLVAQQTISIDTRAPVVTDVSTRLLDGVYTVGDRVIVAVTFSEQVVVTPVAANRGVPTLYLQLGGSTNLATPAALDSSNDAQLYFALTFASGHSTSNLAYPSRTSLRCVGNFGINKDGTLGNAVTSHGVEFQGRLLVVWSEKSPGTPSQIRAKSLDLTRPFGALWAQEDGDGVTGQVQFNAAMDATNPMAILFASTKVYACWQERNGATGNPTQVRVALYVGGNPTVLQRWQFVGRTPTTANGLNRDATQSAAAPHIAAHNSRLYMAWHETVASSAATQIRVALYNGQDLAPAWSFVDGNSALRGINVATSRAAQNVRLVSCRSTLFAAWEELNAAGVSQIRVSSLGGTDAAPRWSNVDGNVATTGLNFDNTMHARAPSIACVSDSTLVVAWHEVVNIGGGGTLTRVRVKQAALGTATIVWRVADTNRGLNFDTNQNAMNVRLRTHPLSTSSLYATWEEVDAVSSKSQVRVAMFSSGDTGSWTFIDGNARLSMVNDAPSQAAATPVLVASVTSAGTWYALWQEMHATTLTTHVRTSILRPENGAIGSWQSLHDRCILRRATTPTTSSQLLLPELNTAGSLEFGRQIRIDTARPTIHNVTFASSSAVIATASAIQTVDVFNQASVTQGQYKLAYDGEETACVDWNAATTAVEAALEGIAAMNLGVSVAIDTTSIQDAARYSITFTSPASGIKPLALISSTTCATWTCNAPTQRLACNQQTLVVLNANRDVAMRAGIVDIMVDFSSPVVVTTGTPQLVLETGTVDATATYTSRGILRQFDVGTESPSLMVSGAFRLAYGDAATPNAMETTDCIDASFASDADARQDLVSKLLRIKALRTIGIQFVSRRQLRNGYRYSVRFTNSSSGNLLDLIPADPSACDVFAGRIQTIDIRADSAIIRGEFSVAYELGSTACISATIRARGPTNSLEGTLSRVLPDRVIPLQVTKDTSIIGPSGFRFYVTFLSPSDAAIPIQVSTTNCAAFLCDDGNGGTIACTGVQVVANAGFKTSLAVTKTLAFQYAVQATDKTPALAVHDVNALSGAVFRSSLNPILPAILTAPSSFLTPSFIRILSTDEIPRVVSVFSSTIDDTYSAGDVIVIYVTFTLAVDVIGRPILELNSGGVATYLSGSGTTTLEFRYKILPGEATADLNYASILSLRTPGSFVNIVATVSANTQGQPVNADLALPALAAPASLSSQSALVVSTTAPSIVSVTSSRSDTLVGGTGYGVGDVIDVAVVFSSEVAVQGTPTIALNSGGTAVFTYAGYRQLLDVGVHAVYPVSNGQFAVMYGGVMSGCIDVTDPASASPSSLQSQLLTFSELATIGIVSVVRSRKKNGFRFEITFDSTRVLDVPASVVPVISDVCAPLLPSSPDTSPDRLLERSTDTRIVFHYIVQENDATNQLDVTSASINLPLSSSIQARSRMPTVNADPTLPAAGSPNRLGALKNLVVDGSPVVVVDVVSDSAAGTYGVAYPSIASPATVFPGEIYFRVIFSRAVKVVGTPTIELATGSLQLNGQFTPNRFGTFVGQPQVNEAAFLYHIQEGDSSANLAFANLNVLANAQVYCVSTSSALLARTVLPRLLVSATKVLTIDATSVPTTVKLSSQHTDGTWGAGEAIDIEVTFSKSVTLQTGLNRNHDFYARYPVATEFQNNLVFFWTEWSAYECTPSVTTSFLYMRVFASDTLNEIALSAPVAAVMNRFPNTFIEKVSTVVWQSDLYGAWDEDGIIYCARFNGFAVVKEPWTVIPSMGANKNLQMRGSDTQLIVHNLLLVMLWREEAVVDDNGRVAGQIRIAQRNDDYDAPLWIFHDGNQANVGLNKDPTKDAISPHAVIFRGTMYVSWSEYSNENDAYQIVIARRYVQSRDVSEWHFIDFSGTSTDFYISSYRPRLTVRKKGFEDAALVVSWYRDTAQAGVSEVVSGEVFDASWSENSATVLRQVNASASQLPGATLLDAMACGDTMFASWIQQSPAAGPLAAHVQTLHIASLKTDQSLDVGWTSMFAGTTANHNPSFDATDAALVCSSSTKLAGVLWTEFDGIATKLHLRHAAIPQRLLAQQNVSWGETTSGTPLVQMQTASIPNGQAFAIDRSGFTSKVLHFLYIVLPGHVSLDFDVLSQQAVLLNGAQVRDYYGQIPDCTLFPRSRDPRSLSYNNDIAIDTTPPVVVDVTSTTPSGEYGVGEVMIIQVVFNLPVAVSGDAAMLYLRSDELHFVDYNVNPAVYVSGSGTTTLTFEFTVSDRDYCDQLDYFRVDSLELPAGARIQRDATFPIADAVLTLPQPRSAHSLSGNRHISIRPTPPAITDVTSTLADGTYYPGDTIPIVVTFTLPVVVEGWPVILLATQQASTAVYESGNGTTKLTFRYAIQEGDAASDLDVVDDRGSSVINYVASLHLAGLSSIKRMSTNPFTNADIMLPAPGWTGSLSKNKNLVIDTVRPKIVDVRSPTPDGTYDIGDVVEILVQFSKRVVVQLGSPYLRLNVLLPDPLELPRMAVYQDGSGTNLLRFVYTVVANDNTGTTPLDILDTNAFLLRPTLFGLSTNQPAAEVLCQSTTPVLPANLTMPRPGPILRVDAVRSLVGNNQKIFLRTDGLRVAAMTADVKSGEVYAPGQRIVISVVFTLAVIVQGTPRLKLNANALLPTYAQYIGGSGSTQLQFEYIVVVGDSVAVLEAASQRALELPAGSMITDSDGLYVPLHLGAPLLPGSLSFNYKIGISSTAPTVQRAYVMNPEMSYNGAFGVGDGITIAIEFSARVGMPAGTPPPTLQLQLINGVRSATYVSGDASKTWIFTISIVAGDTTSAIEYVDVNALVVPAAPGGLFASATSLVLAANPVLPALGSSGSLSASRIRVVTSQPTVVDVSAGDRDGVYALGDRLRVCIQFSYGVTVVPSGPCTLDLFLGGIKTATATLVGGSTTNTLVFEYRVAAGDRSGRLDYRSMSSLLSCNILQLTANPSLAADTTLPAPGAEGSLSFASRIQVDSTAPRIISVSSSLVNGVYGSNQDIDVLVAFSKSVDVVDSTRCNPKLRLAIANTQEIPRRKPYAVYRSGTGSATLVFRYTTRLGDMAFPLAYDGMDALYTDAPDCGFLAVTADRRPSSIRLPTPGGSGSLSNNRDIDIDGVEPPRVVTVTSDMADGIYTTGDVVVMTVIFSTPVMVTGVPFLRLDVGQPTEGQALYQSGSGSARLVFAYTIQNGDHSDRLEYVPCPVSSRLLPRWREFDKLVKCLPEANALQLGGGTIKRVASTPSVDAVLDLPEVSRWPKLRVATSRQIFVFVNQLEDRTDLSDVEHREVLAAEAARLLTNEVSMSQRKSSLYIYSNGIPPDPTPLKAVEQRYFIELTRFPIAQPNPLSLKGFDGFIGIMLNGIPFKGQPNTNVPSTDACGGAIDGQSRYFYADVPSCMIANFVNASPPSSPSTSPFLLLGYAFDGVPVYYFYDEAGALPKQLDECNGMRGRDGAYRYHLRPIAQGPFMPCLKGINDPPTAVRGDASKLIRVFRFPVDIRQVDGLTLSSLSHFDGLVVDENPTTMTGTATWLNPQAVSVVYSVTTITVRSTGIPNGQYGPFPNAYNNFVVREQDYAFQLPRQPTMAAQTTVLPADTPIGVMLNGVPFFSSQSNVFRGNVMDPNSRAFWMMDKCHGLVDAGGNYRYYGTPDCLLTELGGQLTAGQPSPLLGYALDGFPIYGPYTENGVVPTDLDACNGRIGDDGTYRYHATPGKAPYLIGCFRGTIIGATNDQTQRSLSFADALRIDTQRPRITQIFTNKHPGVYTLSETLDIVVVWSVPVVVDTTDGLPSLVIPGSMQLQQAVYSVTKSTPTQSVFVYTVTPAEDAVLEYNYDFRSAIQQNGATIKRAAATPTLDADVQLIWAEQSSRFASKHQLIQDVRVVLRGLYHPHASDLRVQLYHETRAATIFDRCCGSMDFGIPDDKLRVNVEQINIFPDNPTSGVGWDYGFQDFAATTNLARDGGATALQSSTSGSCFASNAIDGRVRGSVSSQDVARADSTPTTVAWWELRLLKPVEIGTIRVWLPQRPERRPATVQILRIDSADGVSQVYGSFTLAFTAWNGTVYTTTDINWNAVAMVRDEDAKISNLGIGKGESIEAKILAVVPATMKQHLYVTRTPAAAGMPDHGAFTWWITFLDDPQLYAKGAVPLALTVHSNNICDGAGLVALAKPYPGDDHDEWAYVTRDDDARAYDITKGHTSMFPFWILLFEDTAVMNIESFQDAVNASTWSYRVDEIANATAMISVNPPVGLKTTQFVRIVAEMPNAFLTLAEVEVFKERNHILSQYPGGSPVSTEMYPGAETWSPEDSFQHTFGQTSSEGRWTLSIMDVVRKYRPSLELELVHGAGALSDWVLNITNLAGNTRTYYMDIRALIKTLPRHGKLYVLISETDTEHLDRDRNGVLDLVEAELYLSSYYLSFDVLPQATRQRVLWNFLSGYTTFGGIEILTDASERQKLYPSPVCDRQCLEDLGLDPYYWPGTTGDRALKPMTIDRDRVVRYIPSPGFVGLDTFTYTIAIGSQEAAVMGTVELNVRECQDKDCVMDMALLHRTREHK